MGLDKPKLGQVIYLHEKPKFINKWAEKFVKVYKADSKEAAIQWALGFLDKEAVKPVADRAKLLLSRSRG
jgi:hypothetical protein